MAKGKPTKVSAHLLSDVGMVREHNEDNAFCDPEGMFFVVADGMGGHAAGEVASAMAVEEVSRSLQLARDQVKAFADKPSEEGRSALVTLLEDAVRKAHLAVFERGGRESDKKGMGTTLDVLLLAGGEAFVAHVGDSRPR
jgi:serine/threonine protein phosphatase PrpC